MIDVLVILWFLIFIIFLIASISAESKVFGIIAGIWLLLLGVGIISDGIQIESGVNIIEVNDTHTTYEYQYIDATYPFSTYSYMWGLILILTSIFIIYTNAEDLL